MPRFTIKTTKREELIDITAQVRKFAETADVEDGVCLVYTPHSTAAIVINENWDASLRADLLSLLGKLVPDGTWQHDKVDKNGAAHLKSMLLGASQCIPLQEGKLLLGKWQGVALAEFDGPRERDVLIVVARS